MTSDSLLNVSDRYIDLESIKEDLQKTPSISNRYDPLFGQSLIASPANGHQMKRSPLGSVDAYMG